MRTKREWRWIPGYELLLWTWHLSSAGHAVDRGCAVGQHTAGAHNAVYPVSWPLVCCQDQFLDAYQQVCFADLSGTNGGTPSTSAAAGNGGCRAVLQDRRKAYKKWEGGRQEKSSWLEGRNWLASHGSKLHCHACSHKGDSYVTIAPKVDTIKKHGSSQVGKWNGYPSAVL